MALHQMLQELSALLSQMNNPDFAETLEQTLAALSGEGWSQFHFNVVEVAILNCILCFFMSRLADDKNAFNGVINPLSSGLNKGKGKGGADIIDADIMKTLQGLSEESKNMEGMDPLAAEAMGEVRKL